MEICSEHCSPRRDAVVEGGESSKADCDAAPPTLSAPKKPRSSLATNPQHALDWPLSRSASTQRPSQLQEGLPEWCHACDHPTPGQSSLDTEFWPRTIVLLSRAEQSCSAESTRNFPRGRMRPLSHPKSLGLLSASAALGESQAQGPRTMRSCLPDRRCRVGHPGLETGRQCELLRSKPLFHRTPWRADSAMLPLSCFAMKIS